MAKRRLESVADYERALRNGYGVGVRESYAPWLRVQDLSSKGRSSKLPGIRVKRQHHLLSDHEKRFFLYAEYQPNIIDIREQFPLLPIELASRIAEQAGIAYPVHPKTKEPIVITTDFVLTADTPTGIKYHPVDVKPRDEIWKVRVLEKLEIARLWWGLLGEEWRLVTDGQLDRAVADNLDWLSDPLRGTKGAELEEAVPHGARDTLTSVIKPGIHIWENLVEESAEILGCSPAISAKLLRAMIWERCFEVDLTSPIQRQKALRIECVSSVHQKDIHHATAT